MKLKYIWNTMSLKRKIMAVFLPLVLLPFLLVLTISIVFFIQNGKEESLRNSEEKLLLVSGQAEQILSNVKYNIKAFSTSSALQNAIAESYPETTYGNYLFTTSMHSAVHNIMDISSLISDGYIQTFDGKVYDIKTDSIQIPTADMNAYYDEIVSQNGKIIMGKPMNQGGGSALNISKSLIDIDTGQCLGILSFDIKETLFFETYRSVIDEKNENFYLVDKERRIISSGKRKVLQTELSENVWKVVQRLVKTDEMKIATEDDVLVLTELLEAGEYYAVYVLDYKNIYREVTGMALIFGIIGGFVLIAAVFLTTVLARSLTKPLAILAAYVDKTGSGDFSIQLQIESKDEIGMLAERFQKMNRNIHNLTMRICNEQALKKEYELNLLQAQINPHFLYNCLDNISSLIADYKTETATSMIHHLGRYYRGVLSKGRNMITIGEEIQLLQDYMEIHLQKAPELFQYMIQIDENVAELKILKMLLQPIVENTILHGFTGYKKNRHIAIVGEQRGPVIYITVEDDGRGIQKDVLDSVFTETASVIIPKHFGLKNVQERIRLKYGEAYGASVWSEPDKGTRVTVSFPKIL